MSAYLERHDRPLTVMERLVWLIPIVNLILFFYWGFIVKEVNDNRKSYSQASLIFLAGAILLGLFQLALS